MSAQPHSTDRDLLVRVDNDVQHLQRSVDGVRTQQREQETTASKLTEQLMQLTFTVGAFAEGMKDAKNVMNNVGQHAQRLTALEDWRAYRDAECKLAEDRLQAAIRKEAAERTLEDEKRDKRIEADKAMWQPFALLAQHWKWLLAGGVAVVGFVGWDNIKRALALLAST